MKFFLNRTLKKYLSITIFSLLTFIILGGLVGYGIYIFRVEIFNYFAKEYIENQEFRDELAKQNLISREEAIIRIVEKANPAVVSIIVSKDVPILERFYEESDPFDFFGFRIPQFREQGTERKEVGGGSGFFVSKEGLIVTNRHVVNDTDALYTVITSEGEKYEAEIVARDPFLDIAVLSVEKEEGEFPTLSFGQSQGLRLGQTVIAIGNALGEFKNSVSVGVISGLSRSVVARDKQKSELLEEVIQTDAAINLGNSGGPLLNIDGEVIGVNVAIALGSDNIGFALPADMVKSVVQSVKEFGEIIRPYLGVRYVQINETIQEQHNLSIDYGVLLIDGQGGEGAIIPDSPAEEAGLLSGDVILEFEGIKLDGRRTFASLIREKSVNEVITLKILRDDEEKTISLTLARLPEDL